MGEHACEDKTQCWEPCGELGNDERYVRVCTDPKVYAAVDAAVGIERAKQGSAPYRFNRLLEELEKRFPDPEPFLSSRLPESYYLQAIDKLIAERK